MSSEPAERQAIDSLDALCRKYGFDGLTIEHDTERRAVFITARRSGHEINRALSKLELTEAKVPADVVGCALRQMADALTLTGVKP